jgi:hypothetical protein
MMLSCHSPFLIEEQNEDWKEPGTREHPSLQVSLLPKPGRRSFSHHAWIRADFQTLLGLLGQLLSSVCTE